MIVSFAVDSGGFDDFLKHIETETFDVIDMLMARFATEIPDRIRLRFDASGARDGAPKWPPVTRRWLEARVTYPHEAALETQMEYIVTAKPLIDTGRLYNSIRTVSQSSSPTERSITISAEAYGAEQHFGVKGKIPARPHMELQQSDLDYLRLEWKAAFHDS